MGFFPAAFVMKRQKMSSKDAINFVRKLRPYSIETRPQEKCLEDYEKFLLNNRTREIGDEKGINCKLF